MNAEPSGEIHISNYTKTNPTIWTRTVVKTQIQPKLSTGTSRSTETRRTKTNPAEPHRPGSPVSDRHETENTSEPHFCVKRVLPALFIAADAPVRVSAFPRCNSLSEHTPESTAVLLLNPFESSRCRLTRVETPSSAAARSLMSGKRVAVSDNHCAVT